MAEERLYFYCRGDRITKEVTIHTFKLHSRSSVPFGNSLMSSEESAIAEYLNDIGILSEKTKMLLEQKRGNRTPQYKNHYSEQTIGWMKEALELLRRVHEENINDGGGYACCQCPLAEHTFCVFQALQTMIIHAEGGPNNG